MKHPLIKINFLLTILISICCLSFKAKAQETMIPDVSYLFLEKLIATAKQNYPVMKQFEIKEKMGKIEIQRQKANWLTPINFSYISSPNNTINFVDPRFFTGYQLGINLNIGDILQKPLNVKNSRQELILTQELTKEYTYTLEMEVKKRYFTYIQQLNNLKLYTKSLEDAAGLLNDLKLRYERGEVTFQNYSEGLISFSTISKSKIEAEAGLLTSKATIEELTITKLEDIK